VGCDGADVGSCVAFVSDGNAGDIYAMNADRSGVTNLTRNPADDIAPAWQP
jgi:hypothetical protein